MVVQDLINKLSKLPPEAQVYVVDIEDNTWLISDIELENGYEVVIQL